MAGGRAGVFLVAALAWGSVWHAESAPARAAQDEVHSLERLADIAEAEAEVPSPALHSTFKGLSLVEAASLALALHRGSPRQYGKTDLERQARLAELPLSAHERQMESAFFAIVARHAGGVEAGRGLKGLEEDDVVVPVGEMAWFERWDRLPPVASLALAAEQFEMFAGEGHDTITPEALQRSYRDVFKWRISLDEARGLLAPLMIDAKHNAEVNRCEFAMGVLGRTVLDLDTVRDADKFYNTRKGWTLKDVRFQSGDGSDSPTTDLVYERVFLGPLGLAKGSHELSRCAFKMVYAWDRDAVFRAFLADPGATEGFAAPKGRDMEEFLHRPVFPHSDVEAHAASVRGAALLERVSRACDFRGSGAAVGKAAFGCVVRALDSWRNHMPALAELPGFPDNTRAEPFLRATDIALGGANTKNNNGNANANREEFERLWANVAGEKSLFMTDAQLSEFLLSSARRTGHSAADHTADSFRRQHKEARFYSPVAGEDGGRMYKEEMYHALTGLPKRVALLSVAELSKALGMIMPVEDVGTASRCDRDCWTVLSPLMEAFALLDGDNDGALSLEELSLLPTSVMPRLRHASEFPALSGEGLGALHDGALKEFGSVEFGARPSFRLAAFASLFRQRDAPHTITLESFVDPPLLKARRAEPAGSDASPDDASEVEE